MAEPYSTQLPLEGQSRARSPYADVLLNRYRIMEARGTGGFGTVLTCWDTRLQRRVAIKRMPLATAGVAVPYASTIQDALAEARTSSMLAHPNIVTVYDFEVEGSAAYLVMEYVDGLTLTELLARVEGGVLTRDECAALVEDIAGALAYAHENGVLHLDIKPTNIMVDHNGTVKLCDFGMATLASAAGYGDARGGTVGYMPPEQIEGDLVDERTDIFSFAVVVWQALFGSSPFAALTPEKSLALIKKGPGKPSKIDPELAGIAEETLLAALDANPSARIPSAESLARQLIFALGEPSEGTQSLRYLLSQTHEDEGEVLEQWEGERLPLAVEYPWLPAAVERVLAAATTLPISWACLAQVFAANPANVAAAAVASAAGAALVPQAGALLASLAFVFALFHAATDAPSVLFAIVAAVLLGGWWIACGIRSRLATPALLLAPCIGSPLASVAVSGAALSVPAAGVTAAAGWVFGRLYPSLHATGFATQGLIDTLLRPLVSPPALLSLVGCVAAATSCAALANYRNSSGYALAGQAVGLAVLVSIQLLSARMENGGIWAEPTWETTGIAVVLCVIVCIADVLHGPRHVAAEE